MHVKIHEFFKNDKALGALFELLCNYQKERCAIVLDFEAGNILALKSLNGDKIMSCESIGEEKYLFKVKGFEYHFFKADDCDKYLNELHLYNCEQGVVVEKFKKAQCNIDVNNFFGGDVELVELFYALYSEQCKIDHEYAFRIQNNIIEIFKTGECPAIIIFKRDIRDAQKQFNIKFTYILGGQVIGFDLRLKVKSRYIKLVARNQQCRERIVETLGLRDVPIKGFDDISLAEGIDTCDLCFGNYVKLKDFPAYEIENIINNITHSKEYCDQKITLFIRVDKKRKKKTRKR